MKYVLHQKLPPWFMCAMLTLFLCTGKLLAQNGSKISVSGKILAENDNSPLVGATITEKGTTNGTSSDADGKFKITISQGAVIVVSFIGYSPQEVNTANRTTVDVILKADLQQLQDVVVVGYGTQKKSTLTGSVVSMKTDEIIKAPTSNATNSLTGRLPGVFVVQRSGKPGDNQADIFIRGRATTGESAPLIIVDGAERPSFGDIDPNEIETISVLKDASATALFGIKGGNGVILITTKVGKEGKPRISYTGNVAIQTYTNLPKTLNAFTAASLLNEANANVGKAAAFTEAELQKFQDHSDPYKYPDFNWFDYLTRKYYPQTQHNINVSGGTKIAKYFVSVGYLFEDGILKKFDNPYGYSTTPKYDRYNFRSNVDLNLSKDLTVSVKLGGRLEERYAPAGDPFYANAEFEYLLSRVNGIPAYAYVPFLPDGRFMENPNAGVNLTNPLGWISRRGYYIQQNNSIESTLALDYKLEKLVKGLSFRTQYAYDAYFIANRRQQGTFTSYYINKQTDEIVKGNSSFSDADTPLGVVTATYDGTVSYNLQSSLNYNRTFGQHSVTGLALFQRQARRVVGAQPAYASQGLVARVAYSFKDRYFAEFNGAYNGSENFASGRRYGFFPAVSAGWTISNEDFLKGASFVSFLKIRGSYGKIGFDKIGGNRFLYLDEYARTSTVYGGGSNLGLTAKPNTAVQFGLPTSMSTYPALIHSRIGNPLITWETSTKRNIGFESSFFNDMFSVNFDLFDEKRTDILLNRQSGLTTYGEAYPSVNFGEVYNHGFEIELKHQRRIGNLGYGFNAQLSFARNEIKNLDEPIGRPDYQKSAGYPIGQTRGYKTDGFYQSQADINSYIPNLLGKPIPGDLKFKDINNDGVISTDDITPIGYSNVPEYSYSIEPNISFKGLSLSVMLQGVTHVSSTIQFDQRNLSSNQMYENMLGRWTPENAANATWPSLQPAVGGNFMSYSTNDFLLTDGTYLKIRNAQLAYQIPSPIVKKIGVKGLRVFVSGQNLYTWTKVLYVDPENFQRRAPQGAYNVYPTSRIYNLGVNIDF
ncbi:SusC/RagA family TonB-linked outer membrane protein [Dyadobacter psychrotolerans]|uniref:TonB-dependent receptor n=1 Tax=Dyadobacter psychrotolerans TaxID=2541721 RepID=A0A4R5DSI1_9BACT|nr:TonB-dependent receptor [Dyadobacter psychrotolerans]TDE17426.1 TonB-dependent receptor [Dyadobacter psychrotolerans]